MTSKEIENALANAEDAFQRSPENPETGLEFVTDPTILQLRKACRLLDAAQFLIDRNGHYTVIIEASFVAIERSIQFYVEAEWVRYSWTIAYRSVRVRGAGRALLGGCCRSSRSTLARKPIRIVLPHRYCW